jgi:predicted CXXCH cytochrome family protein
MKLKNLNYKLILFLVISVICIAFFSLAKRPIHDFEGKCSLCHLMAEGEKEIIKDIFLKEIDFQCTGCHSKLGLSHPTGMKPTMDMPDGFLLDSRGRLTCATCHKNHGEEPFLLIKGKPGRAFCYLCHREGLKNVHGGVGGGAHTAAKKYDITDEGMFVDDTSAECMSCHDSALGREVNIGAGTWLHDQGGSHKIGVDYMRAYAKGGFNHPSMMNENIRLFNGKVGCGTCHNRYSKEPAELVIKNKGSSLCLQCHRK